MTVYAYNTGKEGTLILKEYSHEYMVLAKLSPESLADIQSRYPGAEIIYDKMQ